MVEFLMSLSNRKKTLEQITCPSFFCMWLAMFMLPPQIYGHVSEVYWRDSITHRYDYTSHLMVMYCKLGYTHTHRNQQQANGENE